MIHLDTSILIDALAGPQRSAPALRRAIDGGERLALSTIALYEWLRGPRRREELELQELLLPREAALPFDVQAAVVAADLYRKVRGARGREIDLAIAACAIIHASALWTLNSRDYADVPGLTLFASPSRPQ